MGLLFPNVAYASVDSFLSKANTQIVNPLITLLFALAVVFFLYGAAEFMMNQDNEEKRTAGKKHMLYGIIGLTIMMGVFVIMRIIINTFGIQGIDINSNSAGTTTNVNLPN